MRLIKNALATGIPFGIFMGAVFSWRYEISVGVPAGVACGIFFGLGMSVFAEFQRKQMESQSGLFENEAVIYQGPANHFMKAEGRGGWLTLTATRLAFRSHGKNIQNAPLDIDLGEIQSAEACRTALIIPNGLRVVRKDGVADSFVVSAHREWARVISRALPNKALQSISSQTGSV